MADKLQHKVQGHFSQSYQPLGIVTLGYDEAQVSGFRRSLDISKAVQVKWWTLNGKTGRW